MAHLTHRPLAGDAKKAILSARKEADRLKTTIGTEHLLLGVLHERKGDGRKILKELGVTYDAVRDAVAVEMSLPRPPHASADDSWGRWSTTCGRDSADA